MTKKIFPQNQSRELNKALFKFLKRNKEKFEEFLELSEFESFSEISEKYNAPEEEIIEWLSENLKRPAVLDFWGSEAAVTAYDRALAKAGIEEPLPVNGVNEEWRQKYEAFNKRCSNSKEIHNYFIEELVKVSPEIIRYLMADRAAQCLVVSVDLSRSLETILAEVKTLVLSGKRGLPNARLSWLPIADSLLEVWDLYEQAGQQPVKMTFKQISAKVGRPLSTIKDQWRKAYEMIYGESYSPDCKYATEDKKASADSLCAKCSHASCYKRTGDWMPCQDYLKLAGQERHLKLVEFDDNIRY